MVCKFFRSGRSIGGARNAINYLLNERVEQNKAKVFKGDPDLTLKVIKGIDRRLKFDSGVLSFEEKIENEQVKREIIEDFEKTFFAGLNRDNYNILWVEHRDKNRTELHFIIPRIELSTGKRLMTYFHRWDFKKKDTFQDYVNVKYELSSPHTITKQKLTKELNKNIHRNKIKEKIDQLVKEAVEIGKIKSSQDLKNYFLEAGFKINRHGKNYIGIEKNEIKIRLKGVIYGNGWRSFGELTEEARRRENKHVNKTAEELKQKLNKYRAETAKRYEKLYNYNNAIDNNSDINNKTVQAKNLDNIRTETSYIQSDTIHESKNKRTDRNERSKYISSENKKRKKKKRLGIGLMR